MIYIIFGAAFFFAILALTLIGISVLRYLDGSDSAWYMGIFFSIPMWLLAFALLVVAHKEELKLAEIKAHPCIEWSEPYVNGGLSEDRVCTKRKS